MIIVFYYHSKAPIDFWRTQDWTKWNSLLHKLITLVVLWNYQKSITAELIICGYPLMNEILVCCIIWFQMRKFWLQLSLLLFSCILLWDFAVSLIWLDLLVFWYFLSVLFSFGNYILWFGWESELWTYHFMKLHKSWNIRLLCFGLVFCWVSGYDINSIRYKSSLCLLWFIYFYSSVGIFNKMLCSVCALTLFNFFSFCNGTAGARFTWSWTCSCSQFSDKEVQWWIFLSFRRCSVCCFFHCWILQCIGFYLSLSNPILYRWLFFHSRWLCVYNLQGLLYFFYCSYSKSIYHFVCGQNVLHSARFIFYCF